MFRNCPRPVLCSLLFALACITVGVHGQTGTTNGEWRTYGGDLGSTRYVPHDQINAENFGKLRVAWRFKTDNLVRHVVEKEVVAGRLAPGAAAAGRCARCAISRAAGRANVPECAGLCRNVPWR